MNLFTQPFALLYRNRALILNLTRRELEGRYKGSVLGRVWIIVNQLALLAVYSFVFGFIFKTKIGSSSGDMSSNFALWLYCGLLPWFFINESLTISVRDIVSKVNFVKKIAFPLEILPIVSVIIAFINMSIGVLLLLGGTIVFGMGLHLEMLSFILFVPPLFLGVSGLAMIVASMGVYFRDLAQMVGLIMLLWMYATPIMYNADMVPEEFRFLFTYNPLASIVDLMRSAFFWHSDLNFLFLGGFYIGSIVLYMIGFHVFRKLKIGFSDVL